MPLIDTLRPFEEQLRFTLNRMDGSKLWAYSLWRAPEGANLRASLPFSDEYIQSAGDRTAMTIEVRTADASGTATQYIVGKPTEAPGEATEKITWDGGTQRTLVRANEVFTADEAAEVFGAYFRTDEVPAEYTLRSNETV